MMIMKMIKYFLKQENSKIKAKKRIREIIDTARNSHSVNLPIQSKYGKIRTRKNSVSGHFLRSVRNCILQTALLKPIRTP